MSGYIRYFENWGKKIYFMIEDDSVLVKYNAIWNNKLNTISTIFHSIPVYDEKYIKARVKEFNGVVNTNFWGDKVLKELILLWKWKKKDYQQVYLEECKYKIKKIKIPGFIGAELE